MTAPPSSRLATGMGMGRPGFQMGRRILRVALSPAAARASFVERSVAPAAAGAGALVFALAVLGGRLLVRQQEEQAREAIRRRLEGLGRAGAGLAHQLRNPLATLKGSIQLLLESPAPGSEKRLRSALDQAVRMESLIGQLLDYARPPRAERSSTSATSWNGSRTATHGCGSRPAEPPRPGWTPSTCARSWTTSWRTPWP